MKANTIEAEYLTVPQVAKECGESVMTVHNWLNYHRYMAKQTVLGRPVVTREDFEKFKRERPDLANKTAQTA